MKPQDIQYYRSECLKLATLHFGSYQALEVANLYFGYLTKGKVPKPVQPRAQKARKKRHRNITNP